MTKPPKDDTPPEPAVDPGPDQVRIAISRHLREQRVHDADTTPESAGLVVLEALIASWLRGRISVKATASAKKACKGGYSGHFDPSYPGHLAIAHITQALYTALSTTVEHGVVVVALKAGANALALVIAPMKGLSSISERDLTNQSKPVYVIIFRISMKFVLEVAADPLKIASQGH